MSRIRTLKRPEKQLGRPTSADVRLAANSAVLKAWAQNDLKRATQAAAVELTKRGMSRAHAFAAVRREMRTILAQAPGPAEVRGMGEKLELDLPALGRRIEEAARANGIAAGYREQVEATCSSRWATC
jgi:hypothetical protein